MKIAIIGAGSVGAALGSGWASVGHTVVYAVRDPAQANVRDAVARSGSNASAALLAQAIKDSDVVVLATPYGAAQAALAAAGDLTGKVLLDATNPIAPGLAGLTIGLTTSAGEA